jgi:hypothetical protein
MKNGKTIESDVERDETVVKSSILHSRNNKIISFEMFFFN